MIVMRITSHLIIFTSMQQLLSSVHSLNAVSVSEVDIFTAAGVVHLASLGENLRLKLLGSAAKTSRTVSKLSI